MSLFLKSFDHLLLSQPIKYKIRNLTTNIELLPSQLDIAQLFGTQPKEYINLRQNSVQFSSKINQMKRLLNQMLSGFSSKDNLNLFYSLVLGVNDIIDIPEEEQEEHSLLGQITSLRKKSRLGELSTNLHVLNSTLTDIIGNYEFAHPKTIEAFLLLLRLHNLTKISTIKSTEDAELLH